MLVVRLKGVFHGRDFWHWSCTGRISIDLDLSQSQMSQYIFLFAALIFVSVNNWQSVLVLFIVVSLRVCSGSIFCLRFMNEMCISGDSEVANYFACLFVSSTAWPTGIAFLSVKPGFLSRRSVRCKSWRPIIKISFIYESHKRPNSHLLTRSIT